MATSKKYKKLDYFDKFLKLFLEKFRLLDI